jgi:5-hydroxyisourate hydrolase-like protein (transthyretin family)
MIEAYGQVAVTHADTRKPVPGAYVKVYAKLQSGEVKFVKDGYTDLRGRFDYASLNTSEVDNAQRLSLLILSEPYGAVVREAAPPKR